MRGVFDFLYRVSGVLGALFLCAIVVLVLLQVGANAIDRIAVIVGVEPIGLSIPSYADFTGFFLAAASFLALAYSMRFGAHIRVVLFISHLAPGRRRLIEIWCVTLAAVFTWWFTWYAVELMAESFIYHDLSPGIVAVPLWIPQSAMALGLIVLGVSLLDDFVALLRGRTPSYETPQEAPREPEKASENV